jgi:predicted TIM-barrel fold metal-dependent hydrolase
MNSAKGNEFMGIYFIVDAHVHTYPTAAIGQQALQGAGRSGCSGTEEELLSVMARGKISYAVMANMTPTYDMKMAALKNLPANAGHDAREKAEKDNNEKIINRMKRRNLWTCTVAKENPPLLPFIGIDILQSPPDMQAEIEDKVKNHGAKGLKLHPVVNRFFPYDQRLWPAYSKAGEMGLPVLFHSGTADVVGHSQSDYGRPKNFEPVLKKFPRVKIILAHLAQGFFEELIDIASHYDHVYFDTSAIISGIEGESKFSTPAEAAALIRKLGVHRVLFGSDWPWFDPLAALEQMVGLDLTNEEKESILGKNAEKLFGLKRQAQEGGSSAETADRFKD